MDNALILVVEDEPEISSILTAYLERDCYRTVTAADGETALAHHQTLKPDLVLLDIQLPKRDGISILTEIRKRGDTPVIITTARSEELDRLLAFELGADDYVIKPFNPKEVMVRIKAVLRRTNSSDDSSVIRCGNLQIDTNSYCVEVASREGTKSKVDLTLTEFRLLRHLASRPTTVFERSELVDACLPEGDALERTVDSHISNLRRKLDRAGAEGLCGGVRGVGYRLIAT